MKCIVLAAGRGSRLKKLSHDNPKTLLYINQNKTILDYIIKSLPETINEIIIVVKYKKDKIINYINNKYKNKKIQFVTDKDPKGTLGSVKSGMTLCSSHEKVLILPADDIYKKEDIKKAIKFDSFISHTVAKKEKLYFSIHVKNNKILSIIKNDDGNHERSFVSGIAVFRKKDISFKKIFIWNNEESFYYSAICNNTINTFKVDFLSNNTPEELIKTRKYFF